MSTEESKTTDPAAGRAGDHLDLGQQLRDLKIPGVDVAALVAAQQKNLAALSDANRQVVAGIQQIAQRQADHLRQAVTEAAQAARTLATGPATQELGAHTAELTRQALDKALEHLKEVTDIAAKAHAHAAETVNKRVAESLDELRSMLHRK